MKLLVLGGGGREHALVARLSADPSPARLWCSPGNPGIAAQAPCESFPATDLDGVVAFVRREGVDLVVPGPEAPLALGLADRLAAEGIPCCGPSRAAARLETSKAFAKAFMARHGVPTARFVTCASPEEADEAISRFGVPVVIKADGLAAGKGVVVAATADDASAAVKAALVDGAFGTAGRTLVIEEFLDGTEASFFALCDGTRAIYLGSAEDHKRAFDGDRGPNTGGMGAFAPSPQIDEAMRKRISRTIVEPVLAGMRAEGAPFVGVLYVGLMMCTDGPKVVEFNVRFGDPEAQVLLPLIDGSLCDLLARAAAGELRPGLDAVPLRDGVTVGVVLASGGYPGEFRRGLPISGLDEVARWPDVRVLHAGTAFRDGQLVTDGGRVLTVVAHAGTYADAMARAYDAVDRIHFDGAHARRDIGRRAVARVRVAR